MDIAKTLQKSKKNMGFLMFVGFMLAGVVTPPSHATDLNLTFSFGPGTPRTSSHSRTLTVPGKTLVSVSGSLSPLPASTGGIVAAVPVVIEVFRPEGGSPVASINTAAVAVVSVPFVFALPPTFISDLGCPRSWTVRVRTASGATPLVRVSGTISYSFFAPGVFPNPLPATYSVDMEGPSLHLEGGGASTTPTLAGHDPLFAGVANRSLIQGTEGTFRIKAKWDTAFHVCYLNRIFPLNVALRRSNATGGTGTVANSETASSQTSSAANKVDFTHVVTPADALLPGPWRLRVTNNNTVNNFCTFGSNLPVAIDNFDVENLLPPSFQSTFTPRCSEAVGSSDLSPLDATVTVDEPLNYAFSWTVPEGQNWHHLESMVLRIRDEEKTIISLLFDEPSNTFSLWNEAKDRVSRGFAPGRRKRLQTAEAILHLADTSIVAAGPTSTTVTLNLALSFKQRAAGHTFDVEVAAIDKDNAGNLPTFFDQVGTLTVTR